MDKKKRRLLTSIPPGDEPGSGSGANPAERTDRGIASVADDPATTSSVADDPATTASASTSTRPPRTPQPRTPQPRTPMSRLALWWRIGVTVIALVILTAGQFLNTNDFFPLGSLTQYATAKDLNGTVNSTCIAAKFPGEDEPRRLAFNTATVGIERGDVESQLQRVIDDPELLQSLADSYIRLHPGDPAPETMILCRDSTQLENGRSVGAPVTRTLAEWEVE